MIELDKQKTNALENINYMTIELNNYIENKCGVRITFIQNLILLVISIMTGLVAISYANKLDGGELLTVIIILLLLYLAFFVAILMLMPIIEKIIIKVKKKRVNTLSYDYVNKVSNAKEILAVTTYEQKFYIQANKILTGNK